MKKMGKEITLLIGLSLIILISMMACPPGDNPPEAPTDLDVTSAYPCTVEWTDNSDNEDGFRVYVGYPCTDCENVTNWNLNATVGANETSYVWMDGDNPVSCCNVGECTCVMIAAYNSDGESESEAIVLASVCK